MADSFHVTRLPPLPLQVEIGVPHEKYSADWAATPSVTLDNLSGEISNFRPFMRGQRSNCIGIPRESADRFALRLRTSARFLHGRFEFEFEFQFVLNFVCHQNPP